jgi:hypothetical protein
LCQVAVHPTYASRSGQALIDRALYLIRDWAANDERRQLTGVPDELAFATKPQLAAVMLERARQAGTPARWTAADEVYGGHDLRIRIRELGYDYAVAVPASHRATAPAGRFTAISLLARLPRKAWQRLRAGHGTKGDRHYDWAMIEAGPDDTPPGHDPGHSVLLVRRHRYTGELSFATATPPPGRHGRPRGGGLHKMADRGGHPCREVPDRLDHGQVTCWNSWIRWSLISLVAAALLAVALARTRSAGLPPATDLIPLTSPNCLPFCKPPSSAHRAATWRTPCTGHAGGAVTSTAQRSASADGTRSPPPYEHQLQDHDLQLP